MEIALHATRLKKSNEKCYIRSNTLYNYFSQIVDFENQDYDSLKIFLTNTYWKFFNRNFAENNLCMWRIFCWYGNCNPPGKIMILKTRIQNPWRNPKAYPTTTTHSDCKNDLTLPNLTLIYVRSKKGHDTKKTEHTFFDSLSTI